MATTYKQLQAASTVTLLTTELNTLANGVAVTSSVNGTSGVFNSLAGGGTTYLDGWAYGRYALTLASQTNAISAGAINVWFLTSVDGTNFETGAPPLRSPDLVFFPAATASAQLLVVTGPLPVGYFKVLLLPLGLGSGSALASSANTLKVLAQTSEQV